MKKTISLITIVLSAVICYAQEGNALTDIKMGVSPACQIIDSQRNSTSITIQERFSGEFAKDPVTFIETNFDIEALIADLAILEYEAYEISFKSRKGELIATFDNKGNLFATSLKFENIFLPRPLINYLYGDYKGWTMIKNSHIARKTNGKFEKDIYHITLKKGNQKKKLKINASDIRSSSIAALY